MLLDLARRVSRYVSVAAVIAIVAAAPAKKLTVPTFKYERYTLENGLTVLLHEDHRLPVVGVDLWYHAGPVNEVQGLTGLAHLCEHMMYQGSEHVGEKSTFRYREGAGATNTNGSTGFDRTSYYETVPSNELELTWWLESDRMGFTREVLNRESLTNQRDVVRNELREAENQPYVSTDIEVYHQLFPKGHPYYGAIGGSHADIEAARLTDVRKFLDTYYTPNNATLSIAGAFDEAKLKGMIERYFGPIPKGPEVKPVNVTTPPITSQKVVTVTDTVQLPRLTYAWLMPPVFQPGDADAEMMIDILGKGKASRLYRKLVYEKQIAQSADCSLISFHAASIAQCKVIARPGVKLEDIQREMEAEFSAMRANGPKKAELEGARNAELRDLIGGFQQSLDVADQMASYSYYTGDPGYLPKDVARFERVSVGSLRKLANSYLLDSKSVVLKTVPGPKVTQDVPRSPADVDANVKLPPPYSAAFEKAQEWRKTPPQPGPQPAMALPVPKVFTLNNGLHVYLIEDHSLPVFNAKVVTWAGSDSNPANKPGLASFTAAMLTHGTRSRSAVEIASAAAYLGTELKSQALVNDAEISVDALSNMADASLNLLSDVAEHPVFASQEIDRVRNQQLTDVLEEADTPEPVAIRVGLRALYGDSAYGYPPVGTTNSVKSITRDDLSNFWSAHYGPKTTALILAGDITERQARAEADKYFGTWDNATAATIDSIAEPTKLTRKVIFVNKPDSPETVVLAFGQGVPRSTPDYSSILVVNDVLGALFSSRLNMNLRERRGYTYGAYSIFTFNRFGGYVRTGAQVRADVTIPAAKEVSSELHRITTDPPNAAELKMARDSEIWSLPGQFEINQDMAAKIGNLFIFKLPDNYYATLPGQLAALTSHQVARAATNYIHPDRTIFVLVGDRTKIPSGMKNMNLGPVEFRDQSGKLIQ